MNDKELTTPRSDRTRYRVFNLRIRHLLLIIFGTLSLIAISAITWNAFHVYSDYIEAEQIAGSNDIGQHALALNALLARERGLTAGMLSNPGNYTDENRRHLSRLRKSTDAGLEQLYDKLEQHRQKVNISTIDDRLKAASRTLFDSRRRVNQSLEQNTPEIEITSDEWINIATKLISEVELISRQVMAPTKETEHATRYGGTVKQTFFNFSENAGRERALISAVIAQNRPFRPKELQQLNIYQYSSQRIEEEINKLLIHFPSTPEVALAKAEFERAYKQDYQLLRKSVLQSSQNAQAYPVDTVEWFTRATNAVNSILKFAHAIDMHINDDIEQIKGQARKTVTMLIMTMLLVVAVFIIAFMTSQRRILRPLQYLESSANTIAMGDFTRAIRVATKDEFGDVAEAFEVMRNYLLHDREQRQSAEDELRKLTTAIEQSVSSIIITNIDGTIEYVNPQFHKTTGYEADEVIGGKFELLNSGKMPLATYKNLWETIKQGHVWQGELLNKKKNGELYWELVSISPVRDRDGHIAHFIGIQHDITERKVLEDRLNFMAYHDELTELPNRTLLLDRFNQITTYARRHHSKAALMILDLDRFKLINDTLGHDIGDKLLIEIAHRLGHCLRDNDTIARYGGDEFVILAESFNDIQVLVDLATRLVNVVAEPLIIDKHSLHISASIGITIWPDDGEDLGTLLRLADTAMYHAKDLGRAQFQFYTDELNLRTSQRLQLENSLREAIDNAEFELYYQPQVHLGSGKVIGAEALIRWNHPELGLVTPMQFIPLAEDTGLINPIGDWVLQTACAQATQWQKAGHAELSMAVNVSARQLDDPDFILRLQTILQETGFEPAKLEIEITESSVMSYPDKMLGILNNIKKLGIKLALDDFGTGYSSLSYLRRFPFDKLKIDRSFIIDIANKSENAAITHSIVEMAHSLDMVVLCEGVETEIQLSYLRNSACDEIQGYLISRPVPAGDFLHQLENPVPAARDLIETAEKPSVLLVDDDPHICSAVRHVIKKPWLDILEAHDGQAALDILATRPVQVVVVDFHMPGIDGIDLLSRIKDLYPDVMRIALSGTVHREDIVRAINQGIVHRFLLKPWDDEELRSTVLDRFY